MNKVIFSIITENPNFTTEIFNDEEPVVGNIQQHEEFSITLENEDIRRGFGETQYLVDISLAFFAGVSVNLVSSYLYDKIKPLLGLNDKIMIDNQEILLSQMDEIEKKLNKILKKKSK